MVLLTKTGQRSPDQVRKYVYFLIIAIAILCALTAILIPLGMFAVTLVWMWNSHAWVLIVVIVGGIGQIDPTKRQIVPISRSIHERYRTAQGEGKF